MTRRVLPEVFSDRIFITLSLTIIFLPLPMLVLAALNLSWLVSLSSPVRHAVYEGLGSRYIGVAVAGLLGSVFWINMFFVLIFVCPCFKFDPHRIEPLAIVFWILGSMVLCEVSWVVYLALTPWHPESKIPQEALSAPTVLRGCRQILALKCLIVIILCFMAIWFLFIMLGPFKRPQPRPPRELIIPPTNRAAEDGPLASERPALHDLGQRYLGATTGEVIVSEPEQGFDALRGAEDLGEEYIP